MITSVTVTASRLVNIGNYENIRYDISATAACSEETQDEAYNEALHFVKDKLNVEIERLESQLGKGKRK